MVKNIFVFKISPRFINGIVAFGIIPKIILVTFLKLSIFPYVFLVNIILSHAIHKAF